MSIANYLQTIDNTKTFSTFAVNLTQEPNSFADGARISDTVVYMGNATYPIIPPTITTIGPNADWTPLFFDPSGLNPNKIDYLNIRPSIDLFNFQQLANMTFKTYINSISSFNFSYRLAVYDINLNFLQAYPEIIYDPSNNTRDPPVIDGIEFYGWSVEIPTTAFYAFMEVKNNTSGSIVFEFQLSNSQLENAIDNSVELGLLGSRQSTNIFTNRYNVSIRDISGVEKDLTQLEADVAQLKIDVSNLEIDVSQNTADIIELNSDKLDASGGVLLSDLNADSKKIINLATPMDAGDAVNKVYADGIVVDVDASLNALSSQVSANTTGINSLAQATASLNNNKLNKAGDTMTGILNMGNNKITNLTGPSANGDAVNLAYLNNAIANIPPPPPSPPVITSANGTLKGGKDGSTENFNNLTITSTNANSPTIIAGYRLPIPSFLSNNDRYSVLVQFPPIVLTANGNGTDVILGYRVKGVNDANWNYRYNFKSRWQSGSLLSFQITANENALFNTSFGAFQIQLIAYLTQSSPNWSVENNSFSLNNSTGLEANYIIQKSFLLNQN